MTAVEIATIIARLSLAAADLAEKLKNGTPVTKAEIDAKLEEFIKGRDEKEAEGEIILDLD